jgi:hypothetical protein
MRQHAALAIGSRFGIQNSSFTAARRGYDSRTMLCRRRFSLNTTTRKKSIPTAEAMTIVAHNLGGPDT